MYQDQLSKENLYVDNSGLDGFIQMYRKALAVKLGNTTVYTKLARVCFSKICCVIENLITFLKRYVYCTCNEMLSTNFKRACY